MTAGRSLHDVAGKKQGTRKTGFHVKLHNPSGSLNPK